VFSSMKYMSLKATFKNTAIIEILNTHTHNTRQNSQNGTPCSHYSVPKPLTYCQFCHTFITSKTFSGSKAHLPSYLRSTLYVWTFDKNLSF
jgi:hypothetical protein